MTTGFFSVDTGSGVLCSLAAPLPSRIDHPLVYGHLLVFLVRLAGHPFDQLRLVFLKVIHRQLTQSALLQPLLDLTQLPRGGGEVPSDVASMRPCFADRILMSKLGGRPRSFKKRRRIR